MRIKCQFVSTVSLLFALQSQCAPIDLPFGGLGGLTDKLKNISVPTFSQMSASLFGRSLDIGEMLSPEDLSLIVAQEQGQIEKRSMALPFDAVEKVIPGSDGSSTGGLPGMSALSSIGNLPGLHSLLSIRSLPSMGSFPSFASMGSIPGMSSLSSMNKLPGSSSLGIPGLLR